VALTPEERVRQWFIEVLRRDMSVPLHMMMSEVPLSLGEKQYRADILIYGRDTAPVAVVECKQPKVKLNGIVLEQALRYNMAFRLKYIIITNGNSTCIACKGEDGTYSFIQTLPQYEDMIKI